MEFDDEGVEDLHQDEDEIIDGVEMMAGKGPLPPVYTSHRHKLIEILKNLNCTEVKIYSEASKEFISLLRGDLGGEILREYVQLSPKCSELWEAWKLHNGKPGMSHILSLISEILDHPDGKSRSSGIKSSLDSFARLIVETKLDDLYMELKSEESSIPNKGNKKKSGESRCQSAALFILASVVRRGMSLASEITKNFDFKVIAKLVGVQRKKGGKEQQRGEKRSTRLRRAFVHFAMSFLEVGNPRLLRWVLQQRDMYSGVLRRLGSDDEETVVYVLSMLRDKVLTEDSLISPGLRSVLFGSVTLEQLCYISGNPSAGPGADIAHEVLIRVCTDPRNGLMPGLNMKGNEKRLFDFMMKMKATEIRYHRDLLLAIVSRRPLLCSAYMDVFPYNLEPRPSSMWFAAISLAADLVSSISADAVIKALADPPAFNSDDMQNILKCIIPRAFARSVINKGLLHKEALIKHGSLRLLLESVKSLCNLISAIETVVERVSRNTIPDTVADEITSLHGLPGFNCFADVDRSLNAKRSGFSDTDEPELQKWSSLKQYVQDEVRAVLPDPQVLLKLLPSSSYKNVKQPGESSKRRANMPKSSSKRLKFDTMSGDTDIVIAGVDARRTDDTLEVWEKECDTFTKQELDGEKDHTTTIADIWGLSDHTTVTNEPSDAEKFFHAKLLDVLAFYMRTMPYAFDGSFDFFKILTTNPSNLSIDQQRSLLFLLVEYIRQPLGSRSSARSPELIYKHLQSLINLLIHSQVKEIQDQAYVLARAAMISTGAFDQNISEIDAWFSFLPGYNTRKYTLETQGPNAFHELSAFVIKFLCDAVSTIGNNLYKYLDHTRKLISKLDNVEDYSIGFSPLIICILQKCLRLLESDSGAVKLHERSMISLYVCNTLSLIVQTQVEMKLLPGLIHLVLSETLKDSSPTEREPKSSLCEWLPLSKLFSFVQTLLNQQSCSLFSISECLTTASSSPFPQVIAKVKEILEQGHGCGLVGVAIAFSTSIICASPSDIITNFPLLLTVAQLHFRSHLSFMSSVLFLERGFLVNVANLWPNMCFYGLEMPVTKIRNNNSGTRDCLLSSNEAVHSIDISVPTVDLSSTELAAAGFSLFLKHASFYALLPAILTLGNCESARMNYTIQSTKNLGLLRAKLSEGSVDDLISYLRYVLFWTYEIVLSYRDKPSAVLEELFQMCFSLVEYIFEHLLVTDDTICLKANGTSFPTNYFQAIVDIIFYHPLVTMSLSHPLCCGGIHENESLEDCEKAFLTSADQNFHPIPHCILQFLRKVFNCLLSRGNGREPVLLASRHLGQKSLLLFKEEFHLFVSKRDLITLLFRFNILNALMLFMSPFELLKFVLEMFSKIEENISESEPGFLSALSVGVYIADGALGMLYNYLQQPNLKLESHLFLDRKVMGFDIAILLKVYNKILDFATSFKLQCADMCLLKVVRAVFNQLFARPVPALLPLYMLFSRMIINSPLKMLRHCLYPASKIKAKTLLLLTELNPSYMSLFGDTFLDILKKKLPLVDGLHVRNGWQLEGKLSDDNGLLDLSQDDFVLLLPASFSYLKSNLQNCSMQDLKLFRMIPVFYSGILLNGFSDWKSYVSRNIFEEDYHESIPVSLNGLENLFSGSLLGKAVLMLHYFFILSRSSMSFVAEEQIFSSIYPKSSVANGLLDNDLKDINACSLKESLILINKVVAKINFTMLLLVPPDIPQFLSTLVEEESKEKTLGRDSNRLNCTKLRFMNILVNTLDLIVRKFPQNNDCSVKSCTAASFCAVRFLEYSILKNVVQLSMEIQSYLIELPSIPFMTLFLKSSLLHRFGDPVTLKAIRCIFVTLSKGKLCVAEVLELVLAHSQFVSTVLTNESIAGSSAFSSNGALLQSVPSILKSLDSTTYQNVSEGRGICDKPSETRYKKTELGKRKLELIKLLRVLYYIKQREKNIGSVNVDGRNIRELLSLLLLGYGATLSETDLEMLLLMGEIELTEGTEYGSIAGNDYLWGSFALKVRGEHALDRSETSNKIFDFETVEEKRKMLFRENIPVDSKLCVMTVLNFCYCRSSRTDPLSLERLLQDNFMDTAEEKQLSNYDMVYDPAFILRFSIHSLLMGYIDPVEFSRLGLLAITCVSISSPDDELRELGYKSLELFNKTVENHQNSKDTLQLQLLLTCLQNGITEKGQKIPSVAALFAAEASFVLLDSSHDHFYTISRYLMRSPEVNLEGIPLFTELFGSGSIHFKTDRLWILRLLYVGLNLDVDVGIYIGEKLPEVLLNFCASSLSDHESVILILQILNKSVKFPKLAEHLVQHCGLIPWLSSFVSIYGLDGDEKYFPRRVTDLSLKVINDVISSKKIIEWLQDYALQQLSELSSHLQSLFVGSLKLLKENIALLDSMLHVMISTLRISQNRKIYKPHFTLSLEGLFQLYKAINADLSLMEFNPTMKLGLNTILMSAPVPVMSQMNKARLSKLLTWAICSALWSFSDPRSLTKEFDADGPMSFKQGEESLVSKLLRWAIASIILGSISDRFSKAKKNFSSKRSNMITLQSLLEGLNEIGEKGGNDSSIDEALAVSILYLQQLVRRNCSYLPSVVSALCLLLPPSASNSTGKGYLSNNLGAITLLCSKIRCPSEAKPTWRWSFDQPWEDRLVDQAEIEEQHACQSLLVMFSNALGGGSVGLPGLSHLHVEQSNLFSEVES